MLASDRFFNRALQPAQVVALVPESLIKEDFVLRRGFETRVDSVFIESLDVSLGRSEAKIDLSICRRVRPDGVVHGR